MSSMILNSIPKNIPANTWVAIDTEYFIARSDKHRMHRPVGTFACMQVAVDKDDVYVLTDPTLVPKMFDAIKDCVWVTHNGDFDIVHLRVIDGVTIKPRSKFWDTMYIERIMFNNYYTDFSLADLARRYLRIVMDKDIREEFGKSDVTSLSKEMLEYSARDAEITLRIAKRQRELISDSDFKVWTKIDRDAFWAFLDFRGFRVDVDGWEKLALSNKTKQEELVADLPFNANSPKQIKEFFVKYFKIIIKDTNEDSFQKMLESDKVPDDAKFVIKRILESRKYGKRASTYGMSMIEKYIEVQDGVEVLIADYDINKAVTGRSACSAPNMQNIPVRETKDYRKLFIPRPGHKLIIADYSAQEPRITAYVSNDENLMKWFQSGKDVYIELAKQIFGKDIKKGDPERSHMKAVVLGLVYGMSEFGLSKQLGISTEEATLLINKTMRILSGVNVWMSEQKKKSSKTSTPFGRTLHLNPYSSQSERNALNSPIQGGAADMMKKALICLHKGWSIEFPDDPFPVVGYIHDELVADVRTEIADRAAKFIKNCMENTANELCNHKVPFLAEVSIGDSWADK